MSAVKEFSVPSPFEHTIFVSSNMYLENPYGTPVIVGSMNMGYVYDTTRIQTRNLFRLKSAPIPPGRSDRLGIFKMIWPEWRPKLELSFLSTNVQIYIPMNPVVHRHRYPVETVESG